jgi:hypothetical protein
LGQVKGDTLRHLSLNHGLRMPALNLIGIAGLAAVILVILIIMFIIFFGIKSIKGGGVFLSTLPKYLVSVFAMITILAVFVPLNPNMPHSGLDLSWILSMNQAVTQNLKVGKEIIFTFGPYASICTQSYHPATDYLMVFGSLFSGLCYAVSLLYLAKEKEPYFLFVFLVFLAGYSYSEDSLLFSYPLILAASVSKYITEVDQHEKANPNPWQILAIAIIFAPLGLLPLVKGSFLLICGAMAVLISTYFLYHRYRKLALIVLISPLVSTAIFWEISGQSLLFLPSYFVSMSQIIPGYTEAMSIQGNNTEILSYLLAAIAIIWALVKSDEITVQTKVFQSICFALFLFISFKSGFVRHDLHAITAGTSLIIAILIIIISRISVDKRHIIVLLISITAWAYIDKSYINISTSQVFENIRKTYVSSWDGLRSRMTESNNLQNRFEQSLDEIEKEYTVPALQGTTDIYSFDQAYLLASNNKWNPRPIMQSHMVYTPKLAQINEQHLRGNRAPDNVLFRVQPIDGRLPSLEDGLSWPALFDNYNVTKLDNDLAYLRKNQLINSSSAFDVIHHGTHKTGDDVVLPITNAPIFAELDLKPTLLGKLLGIVFKPPQLNLTLKFKDVTNKDYRVLSNMMQSGFFISPLVKNTKDFVFLATGNQRYLKNNMVESIVVTPSYGGSIFWSATYTLEMKAYRGEMVSPLPENFFDNMIYSVPEGYAEAKSSGCDGSIDVVNGRSPAPQKVSGFLSVEGWLAVSAKTGIVPDDIFVTLKNQSGITRYIETRRTPRNDVKVFFQQPAMPDVGYSTTIDVTALNGEYVLGLARGYKGELEQCQQFNIPLIIGEVD